MRICSVEFFEVDSYLRFICYYLRKGVLFKVWVVSCCIVLMWKGLLCDKFSIVILVVVD